MSFFVPAHPEQRKLFEAFCREEMEFQRNYLCEKYKLRRYKPQLFFNFRTDAVASLGGELEDGEPYISIAALEMCINVGKTDKFHYEEYDFLRDKEGVGDGHCNWKQWTAWLIAHELAHTLVEIQRFRPAAKRAFPKDVACDVTAHGKLWQAIYRDLRATCCIEARYVVEATDYSELVFYKTRRTATGIRYIFWKDGSEVAWYTQENGVFYRTDPEFASKDPTSFKKPSEIRDRL